MSVLPVMIGTVNNIFIRSKTNPFPDVSAARHDRHCQQYFHQIKTNQFPDVSAVCHSRHCPQYFHLIKTNSFSVFSASYHERNYQQYLSMVLCLYEEAALGLNQESLILCKKTTFFKFSSSLSKTFYNDRSWFAPPCMPIGINPWLTFSNALLQSYTFDICMLYTYVSIFKFVINVWVLFLTML